MFISNETRMTKIFLGDTLLWEEPDTVILHGETVPVKSIGVVRSGVSDLVIRTKQSNTLYLGGDLNVYGESKRYSYISPPCPEHGTMILVTSTPTRMTTSNLSGNYTLYGDTLSYLIGSDIYTDAYRWLTVFILSSNNGKCNVTVDYTSSAISAIDNGYAAYAFIDNLSPEDVTVIDNEPIVSSDNMVFTPSSKSSGVNRVYILGNLYSPIVTEPYNNWTSTRNLSNIFNSKLVLYSDTNTYSMMTPTFTLSSECASDLTSVARGITIEFPR